MPIVVLTFLGLGALLGSLVTVSWAHPISTTSSGNTVTLAGNTAEALSLEKRTTPYVMQSLSEVSFASSADVCTLSYQMWGL